MISNIEVRLMTIKGLESVKIVSLKGQIDESNLIVLSTKLDFFLIDKKTSYIVLNFKELDFLNSKVIGYIASYYSKLHDLDKRLIIIEANETILDILSLVGLTNIIDYYPNLKEAVEIIKNDIEHHS